MDNLTHSLFGVALAEAALQLKKNKNEPTSKGLVYLTSILANNFPDFDLLFGFIDSSDLGYLLNHRGFTHTLFFAPLQALLIALSIYLPFRKKIKVHFPFVLLLALVGCCSHILFDFFNSYGVHPFWPLDNNWYYLDTIFIVEPLIWIPVIFLLYFNLTKKWLASSLAAISILVYAKAFFAGYLKSQSVFLALAWVVVHFLWFKKNKTLLNSTKCLIAMTITIFIFLSHKIIAKEKIKNYFSVERSSVIVRDIVMTPAPSNPACWFFIALTEAGTEWISYPGTVSMYGGSCSGALLRDLGARQTTEKTGLLQLDLYKELKNTIDELKINSQKNCRTKAWAQFARAPFLENDQLKDLRFSLRRASRFASVNTNIHDEACPVLSAPWMPPRQELFR